ncbi:igLON family member 5-like [Leptidea sinapis]|uniref:igLON family member 5-like n=1 Tax=Leptidea sinapis TaxID=189913 RepID=UPI00212CC385|nr:igLON family member 5-like [Leptidea sinapis]
MVPASLATAVAALLAACPSPAGLAQRIYLNSEESSSSPARSSAPGSGRVLAEEEAAELAEGVPAWRELWHASLATSPRRPALANTSEEVAAQLAEGVPAWRELWHASLATSPRRPALANTSEEVAAQLGAAAFLHCPVRHLEERGVSWVRRRDWHIISSGVFMYTNDERFQVLHGDGSDDWILQIKYVQERDNGTYECQVSTGSGTLSRLVHLHVAVPEAFILGADEYHVDAGSSINLVCIVEKSPEPPQFVFWFHNARMVNYDAASGVRVATSPGARTQSSLHIRAATAAHSGNYTCRAANAAPASIAVYVSQGSDKMAATLSRNSSDVGHREALWYFVVLLTCLCVITSASGTDTTGAL